MLYRAIRKTLNSKPTLIPHTEKFEVGDAQKDYYDSLFLYNESHKSRYNEVGTLSGITDVVGNRLFFDFDEEANPEEARKDVIALGYKLINMGFPYESLQTAWSGKKGFTLEVKLDDFITPKEFKDITFSLTKDLKTFDPVVSDPNRIVRIINTKHPDSGLYKIPLDLELIEQMNVEEIKSLAKNKREAYGEKQSIKLPENIKNLIVKEEKVEIQTNQEIEDIDFTKKIKGWSNCKWALTQGLGVVNGDRHEKLLCIVATSKALNYTKELAYYTAKNADEQGVLRNGGTKASKEDIWRLVESVYAPNWKGGQFTCKDGKTHWLSQLCISLGHNKCNHEKETDLSPKTFADLKSDFKTYVKNIDKNTIYTGLPSIDQNVFLSTGANVIVLAASGAGKTSLALEFLENTSRAGVRSVVASLDMAKNRIFEKVLYRLTGLPRQDLYKVFQNDNEDKIMKQLEESYSNVNFFKKSTPSVSDIKEYVMACNEKYPDNRVKLVVIDYFERISSSSGDDTASSKIVAGQLQDLVDELDICLITLYQPTKSALSGGPDSPLYDYSSIKGSAFIFQSARIILSCWRPFYNPKDFTKDKFLQMAVLKNDLGELAEFAFGWEGKRGKITELEDFQKEDFEYMLREKEEKNKEKNGLNF